MKRKISLAFHTLSKFAGKVGLSKIPGTDPTYRYISNVISPTVDGELAWINYEGYQLKIVPDDHVSEILLKTGTYEAPIVDLIHKKVNTGDIVVDIGAHIGHHTLLMRATVGETGIVIAYEPYPRNAQYIRDSVEKNGLQNVSVIEAALSDTNGAGELKVDKMNTGSSSLHAKHEGVYSKIEVKVNDADEEFESAAFSSIDFAKVDIQGGEYNLIVGNDSILDTIEKMVIEIHPTSFLTPDQAEKVYEKLNKRGQIESLSGRPLSKSDIVHSNDDISVYWEANH